MPTAVSPERPRTGITRLTGARLVKGDRLVEGDLWISSVTGKILPSQQVFYDHHVVPDVTIDLKGKIVSPGLIDVQFNGGFGYDFSTIPEDMSDYAKGLKRLNRHLVRTGVTSYLPTIPSQLPEVYHKALPYLSPSGAVRDPLEGAESLGAHCEGPFISSTKNGIHSREVLCSAPHGFEDLQRCYGADNLSQRDSPIRLITTAPEVEGISDVIPELVSRNIIVAIGHTEATYEEASDALARGATMITHLFNAMRPLHHRNPGVFGTLASVGGTAKSTEQQQREPSTQPPYFGLISDGIHLHHTTVKLAYHASPSTCILVTDAMKTMGQPDGVYPWTNGDRFVKKGSLLTLEGTDTIAGSSAMLIECVSNFWRWTCAADETRLPEVLATVTSTPAAMLGLQGVKGSLTEGADADLCVLDVSEEAENGETKRVLKTEMVWKFGVCVHDANDESYGL